MLKPSVIKNIKRTLLLTLLIGTAAPHAMADTPGEKKLREIIAKIDSAPSITADFTLEEGNRKTAGQLVTSGDGFYIYADDGRYETWYDGLTQWTWSDMTGEINMSEPTTEELMECNPLAIMNSSADTYKVKIVSSDAAATVLQLEPRDKKNSEISQATLKVSNATNFPVELKVILKDRDTLLFGFTNIKTGSTIPVARFRYKSSYHPGVEIIDLR